MKSVQLNPLVVLIAVAFLQPAPRNARRHSKKQIRKLAKLIGEYGFLVPVLVTKDGRIIAGHGRVEAAKLLGLAEIPAIYVEHLTPAQIEALALAENRVSDEASWSPETLSLIVGDLAALGDFDLSLTAFDTAEIDLMLVENDDSLEDDEAAEEPSRSQPAISRVGDLWRIGQHVVICGNALLTNVYEALLGEQRCSMSINDVPFNVPIAGHVSGTGRHAEFPMASGEMSPAEFTTFINEAAQRLAAFSVDGSLHFLFMDFRHIRELLDGAGPAFTTLLNLCVWVKRNAGLGSLYRSRHELVFLFKSGSAPHINNVELGRHGRNRSNVWGYAGANSFGRERDAMLARHPTSKPVDLVADAILDCSNRGDLVLDAFLGSGTTLIACERTGRRCRGVELDPYYVDLTIERAERLIGVPAIHAATGKTFAQVAHARRNPGWSLAS